MVKNNETYEKLLFSAKTQFLEKGYEGTNMREICTKGGLSTGAFYFYFKDKLSIFEELVSPVLNDLDKWYEGAAQEFYNLLDDNELLRTWEISEKQLEEYVDYIYDNYDEFKLLLACSHGTPFYGLIDNIVKKEVDITLPFFDEIRRRGGHVNSIEKDDMHLILHSYYSAIFEIVLHDFDKKRAKKSIHTIARFFTTGWKEILGLC